MKETVSLKGIYVLIICLNEEVKVNIGALGEIAFKEGLYAYVGSAQNNLEQRVKRHISKEKRKFWHIDYLLGCDVAKVVQVLYKQADKMEECAVANLISKTDEAVEGFGCSDCHCKSHLFRVETTEFLEEKLQRLNV